MKKKGRLTCLKTVTELIQEDIMNRSNADAVKFSSQLTLLPL